MKKLLILMMAVIVGLTACVSVETSEEDDVAEEEAVEVDEEADEEDDSLSFEVEIDPDEDLFNQFTELSAAFDASDCQEISFFIAQDKYDSSPEILEDPAVIEGLGVELAEALQAYVEEGDHSVVSQYCEVDGHKYVTAGGGELYDSITILAWVNDGAVEVEPSLKELTTVDELMDLAYAFQPESELFDGDHIVKTGYGDAGAIWWAFHRVDAVTGKTELLEKCAGSFWPPDAVDESDLDDGIFYYDCEVLYEGV